jgi:hypothetical protein
MYQVCGPSAENPTGGEWCRNYGCHTHHPRMPSTNLFLYHTDTQRRNADFQQTASNKCWQLLATCCKSSVRVLPEPRELPRSTWANFVRTSSLCKSRNLQCGHIHGRIVRCRQYTPTEITMLHDDSRKMILTEVDYVLPVEEVHLSWHVSLC